MVLDLCGGTPSEITVAGDPQVPEPVIDFPLSELKRLAGLDVPLPEVRGVLDRLGFLVAGQDKNVKVAVPSWRPDVHGKADIVEEVVRIVGVDRVPSTPFDRGDESAQAGPHPGQVRTRKAKRALAARGMVEAVTWSFISKPQAELFGGGKPELALANPIAADLSDMRPSLLPGLIAGGAAATPTAASPMSRCSRSGRSSAATGRRISSSPLPACGARSPRPSGIGRHWQGDGRGRRLRREGRRAGGARGGGRADAGAADRAGRAGLVPSRAAPARSRSGRRTCSAISANCIRARSKRSTPKGRWWRSR